MALAGNESAYGDYLQATWTAMGVSSTQWYSAVESGVYTTSGLAPAVAEVVATPALVIKLTVKLPPPVDGLNDLSCDFCAYVTSVSTPAVDTIELILTSTVLTPIPVIIPFRYPLNTEVVPTPADGTFVSVVVTPIPTDAAEVNPEPTVRIWSALSSITQTFRLFAHEPGFLAAKI